MFKNLYTTRMSGDGKLLQRRFVAIRRGGSFSRLMTAAAITSVLVVIIVTAAFAAALNDAPDYEPVNREDTVFGANISDSDENNEDMDPWGITLTATNVTDTDLTIVSYQSGGDYDNKNYYAEFDISEATDNKKAERVHPVHSDMEADTEEPVVDTEQDEEAEDVPAAIGEMRKQFINEYLTRSDLTEIPTPDRAIEEAPMDEAERNDGTEDVPDEVDEMRKQFIVDHLL